MEKKLKILNSIVISTIIVVVFITAITIVADLQPLLKSWLKNTFFHHWIGKGILSATLFAILTFLFSWLPFGREENKLGKWLWFLFGISILGTLAIFVFYIYEAFLLH